jgi:hypothetical protein
MPGNLPPKLHRLVPIQAAAAQSAPPAPAPLAPTPPPPPPNEQTGLLFFVELFPSFRALFHALFTLPNEYRMLLKASHRRA